MNSSEVVIGVPREVILGANREATMTIDHAPPRSARWEGLYARWDGAGELDDDDGYELVECASETPEMLGLDGTLALAHYASTLRQRVRALQDELRRPLAEQLARRLASAATAPAPAVRVYVEIGVEHEHDLRRAAAEVGIPYTQLPGAEIDALERRLSPSTVVRAVVGPRTALERLTRYERELAERDAEIAQLRAQLSSRG